ncbi:hypothetical protein [Halobaculum sp. D14]|uniref:sialidase family protein n=1 Tax=Halobaculum sp. D14 TaxID=3421642 RepID=UPI003EB7F8CD
MWETGPDRDEPEWREVPTPFSQTLFDVVDTTDGPYAIGAGGTLVADRGDGWEVVLDDGPNARENQLRALDVTDDGKRVWFLGSSGAVGMYDVTQQKKYDYSYPKQKTSTWEGIAVAGESGTEKGLMANGSGEIMPFVIDGFDVDWEQVATPAGKASKVAALAASSDGVGYAIDTSGNAYRTTEDDGWKDIGIVNAQVKFYDVYAGQNRVYVAGGDGRLYRRDDSYHGWTPISVTDKTALRSFDVEPHDDGSREMVVLGNSGAIFHRTGDERWERVHTPVSADLYSLSLGETDVAVGASGTVVERAAAPRQHGTSPDGDNFDDTGENQDADQYQAGESGTSRHADDGAPNGSSGGSSGDASGGTSGGTSGDTSGGTSGDTSGSTSGGTAGGTSDGSPNSSADGSRQSGSGSSTGGGQPSGPNARALDDLSVEQLRRLKGSSDVYVYRDSDGTDEDAALFDEDE